MNTQELAFALGILGNNVGMDRYFDPDDAGSDMVYDRRAFTPFDSLNPKSRAFLLLPGVFMVLIAPAIACDSSGGNSRSDLRPPSCWNDLSGQEKRIVNGIDADWYRKGMTDEQIKVGLESKFCE